MRGQRARILISHFVQGGSASEGVGVFVAELEGWEDRAVKFFLLDEVVLDSDGFCSGEDGAEIDDSFADDG